MLAPADSAPQRVVFWSLLSGYPSLVGKSSTVSEVMYAFVRICSKYERANTKFLLIWISLNTYQILTEIPAQPPLRHRGNCFLFTKLLGNSSVEKRQSWVTGRTRTLVQGR